MKEYGVILQDLFVFSFPDCSAYCSASFRLLFRYCSIGATIGANLRFIGAIGAIIGANLRFIGAIFYDIIYDTKRFTMTFVELSMTSNIDYLGTNN